MDDDKKEQVTHLAGNMFGACLDSVVAHGIPWETCVFSALLTAKMLATVAVDGLPMLPGFKCELADHEAMNDRLRAILEEVLLVSTIAHRVNSPEELEAFVEQMEGSGARTTH